MYYEIEQIHPRITRIWDVSRTAMYLVEGSEGAALIDTGVGVGSLRAVVERLTSKPVTVLLTHGHVDHAMGAEEFDRAYMHPADLPVYRSHSKMPVRRGYVAGAAVAGADPQIISTVRESDYLTPRAEADFLPLEPGSVFPLGGISVQPLAAPGHTPGSVVFLIPEERMLLLGDACNAFTYLFESFCPSVARYRQTLLGLQRETDGKYDRTLYSHGTGEGCVDMIANVITVCDSILAGKADDIPFCGFNGEPALIARAMDLSHFRRADGGEGNIVYNPDRVY